MVTTAWSSIITSCTRGSAGFVVGFSRTELERFRDQTVPDLVGPGLQLLFVGINPGLWTAATQTHFAHPSNRFYPALLRSGLIEREIDRSAGFTDEDRRHLIERGIGISNLVRRATARASELSAVELREGGAALVDNVEAWRPRVVAVSGITAYRTAFGQTRASLGLQNQRMGDATLWVVPNPSGLNAHETIGSLAEWFTLVGQAAGLLPES